MQPEDLRQVIAELGCHLEPHVQEKVWYILNGAVGTWFAENEHWLKPKANITSLKDPWDRDGTGAPL